MAHSTTTWAKETAIHAAEASDRPEREQLVHAALLHDIFGNPFRPAAVDPTWLTWNCGTMVKLTKGIYDDRRFADLPILADALEEAGCQDQTILDHLRSPGPHVRGCWPLDLILGRA
jgi:hypothetical protein